MKNFLFFNSNFLHLIKKLFYKFPLLFRHMLNLNLFYLLYNNKICKISSNFIIISIILKKCLTSFLHMKFKNQIFHYQNILTYFL
jgi:hypothetical protein